MAKEEVKTEVPKDRNAAIYERHVAGVNPATIAEEFDIDNLQVLAIIQSVQDANRDK